MNPKIPDHTDLSSLNLINIRNVFYLNIYRGMILAVFLGFILIILMAGFWFYQHQSTAGTRYFPTSADGVLIDIPPLNINHLKLANLLTDNRGYLIDQPRINVATLNKDQNNALVIYWIKQVINIMFDYDYINYRRTLQDLRNYFAPGAHELFMRALESSKNLEAIKNGQRTVRAQILEDPIIKKTGIVGGRYAWNIHVPIDVYYENVSSEPLIQEVIAKIWVVRVSTLQSPFFGLSVVVINLEPRTKSRTK